VEFARAIEEAGADALELNAYFIPADPRMRGAAVEQFYIDVLQAVRDTVSIPIAMKLSPFFSSLGEMAGRLARDGANGLVLFNRFYQPDLDVDKWRVLPKLDLSSSAEMRLPLQWIAILYSHVSVDLALTTGVHTAADVVKGLAAGATVTMLASELLQRGIRRLQVLRNGLSVWLEQYEYESVAQLRGKMSLAGQTRIPDAISFERANYLRVLSSYLPNDPWRYGALGQKSEQQN
jgi:dihydroorotate dehydrogenase (fumarate)